MGKIIKIVVSLLVAALLLLVVAAVVLPLLIDPNDFRDEISTLVEKQTGRKLQIEGEIGFSVFPWLGIELGAMELSNAPG
ncbi:MAG TPA: AsmA family protein, partial [Gammaproteobacteria bacterium]|nr:AsmA family protein [Gammaproteobacteria bacterium]